MRIPPDGAELLAIASETLKQEVLPALSGDQVYALRMALNAMGVAQRQLVNGTHGEDKEAAQLAELGMQGDDLAARNRAFAQCVRAGGADQDDAMQAFLWQQTLGKVRESAPGYLRQIGCEPGPEQA